MKKTTLLLLTLAAVAGCASAPPTRTVKIDSAPSGARVFWAVGANEGFAKDSRQYIGTTPCTWVASVNGDGSFKLPGILVYSMFVPPVLVITADPPENSTNLFQQHQVFHGGTIATGPNQAPESLFFDLSKKP